MSYYLALNGKALGPYTMAIAQVDEDDGGKRLRKQHARINKKGLMEQTLRNIKIVHVRLDGARLVTLDT